MQNKYGNHVGIRQKGNGNSFEWKYFNAQKFRYVLDVCLQQVHKKYDPGKLSSCLDGNFANQFRWINVLVTRIIESIMWRIGEIRVKCIYVIFLSIL